MTGWQLGLEVVLGLFFLAAGWLKLLGHSHMRREFQRFRYPYWLARLAGALEVLAAPGLLLGYWFPVWALLGALLLCCVMAGAAYVNFSRRPAVFGWGTLVILGLCALAALGRRDLFSAWI